LGKDVPRRRALRASRTGLAAALALALALAGSAGAQSGDFDRRTTGTAQILAGIVPPPGDPVLDRLVTSKAFAEHQKWMGSRWARVSRQIATIEAWRDQEVTISGASGKTLLYPFSGPDFLNAYALFPDHPRYIFFSLERPGKLPDLESLTVAQFAKLLPDVRHALRDIFERNYFITDYMSKQLTTPWVEGTVPIMAAMMALMDLRIVRIEPIDLYPELTVAYQTPDTRRPRKLLRGVRLEFSNGQPGPSHELYYFSVDATDKSLDEFYPAFRDWVGQHRPASALLKSASYLLHDSQFEKTRNMILTSADFVIQDDSGIPYRFLHQLPWHVRLYGRYHRPIRELHYGYQADLESAYKARSNVPELPFPFGYHWKGKRSGLLIAHR